MIGYNSSHKAVRVQCKCPKIYKDSDSLGLVNSPRGIKLIPDPDVWNLIMKSKLPEAQKIEELIAGEVLLIIRKTVGVYMVDDSIAKIL